jgi:hypothetical protein
MARIIRAMKLRVQEKPSPPDNGSKLSWSRTPDVNGWASHDSKIFSSLKGINTSMCYFSWSRVPAGTAVLRMRQSGSLHKLSWSGAPADYSWATYEFKIDFRSSANTQTHRRKAVGLPRQQKSAPRVLARATKRLRYIWVNSYGK